MTGLNRILKTLAVLALCLVADPGPVLAQGLMCGPHDKVVESLKQNYAEIVQAEGLTSGGVHVEIFVSPQGSWTIIVAMPEGTACLIADGINWQTRKVEDEPDA